MSKYKDLGKYILWKGKLAKIVCYSDLPSAGIEMIEQPRCKKCGEPYREMFHIIIDSPLFKKSVEAVPTIKS